MESFFFFHCTSLQYSREYWNSCTGSQRPYSDLERAKFPATHACAALAKAAVLPALLDASTTHTRIHSEARQGISVAHFVTSPSEGFKTRAALSWLEMEIGFVTSPEGPKLLDFVIIPGQVFPDLLENTVFSGWTAKKCTQVSWSWSCHHITGLFIGIFSHSISSGFRGNDTGLKHDSTSRNGKKR
jgi:hypothetical protein